MTAIGILNGHGPAPQNGGRNSVLRAVVRLILLLSLTFGFISCDRQQGAAGSIDSNSAKTTPLESAPATSASIALPATDPALALPPEANPFGPPPIVVDAAAAPWEKQIAAIALHTPHDGADRARRLFASLPHLPEEALARAAEQAVEWLPDADYSAVALPVVTNPRTQAQVLSVLFADLMERPKSIALPALLLIARTETHPFSPAALDNLRLLLDQDFGGDWSKWSESISAASAGGKE